MWVAKCFSAISSIECSYFRALGIVMVLRLQAKVARGTARRAFRLLLSCEDETWLYEIDIYNDERTSHDTLGTLTLPSSALFARTRTLYIVFCLLFTSILVCALSLGFYDARHLRPGSIVRVVIQLCTDIYMSMESPREWWTVRI